MFHLLSLVILHLQPRVCFVQRVKSYLFVYLHFLSRESVCLGRNWLHGSSGSSLTQDDGRRTGKVRADGHLPLVYFCCHFPILFFHPIINTPNRKQEWENISSYKIFDTLKLVRRVNQDFLRSGDPVWGEKREFCHWSLLISTLCGRPWTSDDSLSHCSYLLAVWTPFVFSLPRDELRLVGLFPRRSVSYPNSTDV